MAGMSASPNGTSRIAPTAASAASEGRISDSIGTPSGSPSPSAWSEPSVTAPTSRPATAQTSGPSMRLDEPDDRHGHRHELALQEGPGLHGRGWYVERRQPRRWGLRPTQSSSSDRDRVLSTTDGSTHARRACVIPQRT